MTGYFLFVGKHVSLNRHDHKYTCDEQRKTASGGAIFKRYVQAALLKQKRLRELAAMSN